jgi:hypothetical protein
MATGQTPDVPTSFSQVTIRLYATKYYLRIDHDEYGELYYSHVQKDYVTFQFFKTEYSAEEVKEMFGLLKMDYPVEVEFARFLLFAYCE